MSWLKKFPSLLQLFGLRKKAGKGNVTQSSPAADSPSPAASTPPVQESATRHTEVGAAGNIDECQQSSVKLDSDQPTQVKETSKTTKERTVNRKTRRQTATVPARKLSPLTDLYATDVIPEASLVVERANMDGAKSFQSTRTILSAGARRSFGDWALGWKDGGYYDDIEISGPDKGNAQGVFASVSAMREFGAGMRLFGQALLGYGVEDRTRYVSDFDVSKRLDTTTHAVSLGASIGIGRKFAPDQIALSFMPYAQLSWDGIHRDDVRESDSRVAQEYEDELLSVAALEAGLAFKTRSSAASPTGNLFLEGRIAYRNRFHVNGDETYTWTGIRDETNVEFFDNRHAAAAQCKIGWVSSTGHEFALMLDGEAGDSGDERWGASLRWTKHF